MITSLSRARLVALLALLFVVACEDIPQDSFVSRGGISPDPTAILEGSIVYNGPAPTCTYEGGQAEVVGNVVLTLYEYDKPPFPEGSAAGSANLLVVLGSRLFDPSDCPPEGTRPDPATRISRSVPFVWPRLTLSPDSELSYQIRGFYDYDNDFNPLFSVTRMATAGDVVGAALNDARDVNMGLFRVVLPKLFDAPNGVVRRGITVVLGSSVSTERPVFRLGSDRRMSADAPFTPVGNPEQPDALATLRSFRALTCSAPGGDGSACGLSLERLPRADEAKLLASDITLDFDNPAAYAFYLDKVDLKTIVEAGVDRPAPDTRVDAHPVLGTTLGVDWYTPMVFLTRRRTSASELEARIPNVRLIGSLLLDDLTPELGRAYPQSAPIVVPPMALVEWTANEGTVSCRVPYVAPRTPAAVTAGQLAHCGELPTGYYDVSVYQGATGGLPGSSTPGTMPSFQAWTVPNELGDAAQVKENVIASQGAGAAFFVSDPNGEPSRASCEAQAGSQCAGTTLPVIEPDLGRGFDSPTCLPKSCCDEIRHLCSVPICGRTTLPEEGGRGFVAGPTDVTPANDGDPSVLVPNCVPFEMPRQCCPGGNPPAR